MTQDPNETTIDAYNREADKYIVKTPPDHNLPSHLWLKQWINSVLSCVRQQGRVLEIGSATPRDARYIRQQGFSVQCSDAADSFLRHLTLHGEKPIKVNVIKDQINNKYDLIFANAVLPHLADQQLEIALDNIHQALNQDGVLAFNVKEGEGEAWIKEKFTSKRYVNYWQPSTLNTVVVEHGFRVIKIDSNIKGDQPDHVWIHVIARRIDRKN